MDLGDLVTGGNEYTKRHIEEFKRDAIALVDS